MAGDRLASVESCMARRSGHSYLSPNGCWRALADCRVRFILHCTGAYSFSLGSLRTRGGRRAYGAGGFRQRAGDAEDTRSKRSAASLLLLGTLAAGAASSSERHALLRAVVMEGEFLVQDASLSASSMSAVAGGKHHHDLRREPAIPALRAAQAGPRISRWSPCRREARSCRSPPPRGCHRACICSRSARATARCPSWRRTTRCAATLRGHVAQHAALGRPTSSPSSRCSSTGPRAPEARPRDDGGRAVFGGGCGGLAGDGRH